MSYLSGFISWRDLIIKLFIKNVFFTYIGNNYSLKIKKNTVSYASTTNQIKIYWRLFKKMSEVLLIPVTTEILLDLIPCQAKGKFLYPLKR